MQFLRIILGGIQISKKRIELLPNNSKCKPTTINYATIKQIMDDHVIVKYSYSGSEQLIPKYRFIKESDKANLCIGAEVKVNYYFSDSTRKKLLAYNAELTAE